MSGQADTAAVAEGLGVVRPQESGPGDPQAEPIGYTASPRPPWAWVMAIPGLRHLRSSYAQEFQRSSDELLEFFDRSDAIEERTAGATARVRTEVSAHVMQTNAYGAWGHLCEELHNLIGEWILLLTLLISIAIPLLRPTFTSSPMQPALGLALIPLGALAVLSQKANRSRWKVLYAGALAAGCSIVLRITPERFSTDTALAQRPLIVLTVFVVAATIILASVLPLDYLSNHRLRIALFLAVLATASALAALPLPRWPRWVDDGLRIGLWVGVLSTTMLGFAYGTDALIRTWISRSAYVKQPIAEIVSGLLNLLRSLEEGWRPPRRGGAAAALQPASASDIAQQWRDIDFRKDVAGQLERVAQRFERDLPRRLRTTDTSDAWLRARSAEFANSVREWKQEVFFPRADSRNDLIGAVAQSMIHIAESEWALLAHTKSSDRSSTALRSLVSSALRNLMAALLPLTSVLAIKASDLNVNEEVLDSLIPFAGAWLAIRILAWLVPESRGQVSGAAGSIEEITGWIGPR
jgi:hypothetical protein